MTAMLESSRPIKLVKYTGSGEGSGSAHYSKLDRNWDLRKKVLDAFPLWRERHALSSFTLAHLDCTSDLESQLPPEKAADISHIVVGSEESPFPVYRVHSDREGILCVVTRSTKAWAGLGVYTLLDIKGVNYEEVVFDLPMQISAPFSTCWSMLTSWAVGKPKQQYYPKWPNAIFRDTEVELLCYHNPGALLNDPFDHHTDEAAQGFGISRRELAAQLYVTDEHLCAEDGEEAPPDEVSLEVRLKEHREVKAYEELFICYGDTYDEFGIAYNIAATWSGEKWTVMKPEGMSADFTEDQLKQFISSYYENGVESVMTDYLAKVWNDPRILHRYQCTVLTTVAPSESSDYRLGSV